MAVNKDEIKLDREALMHRATELHHAGFNCAQSVLCALAPELGIDADSAFMLAEGFGAGMGGKDETCGAISGGVMALGHVESTGTQNPTSKKRTYELSATLCDRFRQKNGSTICRHLKGVDVDHAALRSCDDCITDAVELVVDIISGE